MTIYCSLCGNRMKDTPWTTYNDGDEFSPCCDSRVTDDFNDIINDSILFYFDGDMWIVDLVVDDGDIKEAFFTEVKPHAPKHIFGIEDIPAIDQKCLRDTYRDVMAERNMVREAA